MRCGRWRGELLWLALTVVTLLIPRASYAHAVGISRGEYHLRGGTVIAVLLFARTELLTVVPELDADRDGSISDRELRAAWPALTDAIVRRIEVHGSAGVCDGTLQDAALIEEDGLSIRGVYRCPDEPERSSISLGFLNRMAHGHRHLAEVTNGDTVSRFVAYSGNAGFDVANAQVAAGGLTRLVGPLFRLGVTHILTGYDHLVFLLGLILIGGRLRSLVLALTAFTVGHSITLGLSVLSIWSPSALFVEPAIALSIAYVGVENWFVANADRRWLVTFPFGLIHGFGFAGALQQISLPLPQIPVALAAFNGGVEAGQIAAVLLVLPMLVLLRRRQWFVDRGVKASSAAIAVAGVWWFISRVV